MKIKKQTGFTLIELMITVAVIGILASIAYPSFQEQIRRTRRADAQGALLGLSNAMERHFTVNNTYCDAAGAGGANSCGVAGTNDTGPPLASLYPSQSPLDGATKYYDLRISVASLSGFTLQATRIASSAQGTDKCGNFTLTNTGLRGTTLLTVADCWK